MIAADNEISALVHVGFAREHQRRRHGDPIYPNHSVGSVAVAGNHVPGVVPAGRLEGGDIAASRRVADLKTQVVLIGGVKIEALFAAAAPGQRGRSGVTAELPLNHEEAD